MASPEVTVACNALREDAKKWLAAAAALEGARQAIERITFADKLGSIPQFVGGAATIIASYERVQQKFMDALSGGVAAMTEVATILMKVADDFEREDRGSALRIKRGGR